jgi:hypothetical protein
MADEGASLIPLAYEESAKLLGVPYSRHDPNSHSYVDLKRDPDLIEELPELYNEPEIRRLVIKLNEPDGYFRSIGCERKYVADDEASGRGRFTSYVGFALDAWPFESKEAAQSIASTFNDYAKQFEWSDNVQMIIEIQPTVFYDSNQSGWSLDFWACGFGHNEEESRSAWSVAMSRFTDFVDVDNKRWKYILASRPKPGS